MVSQKKMQNEVEYTNASQKKIRIQSVPIYGEPPKVVMVPMTVMPDGSLKLSKSQRKLIQTQM